MSTPRIVTARTASIAARIMHLGILFGIGKGEPTEFSHVGKGQTVFVDFSGHCALVRVMFYKDGWVDSTTPGVKDTLTWEESFYLNDPDSEDRAAAALSRLEHALGIVPSFRLIGSAA